MTNELTAYAAEIRRVLDRVCATLDGLSEAQLNWRPPAPEANSACVIATHVLGNLEAWVLGIACGLPIERDRPAEFRAAGPNASAIVEGARNLAQRFDEALAALPASTLDDVWEPAKSLWGEGGPRPLTVREALIEAIEHAAIHLGQLQITRDLAPTEAKS